MGASDELGQTTCSPRPQGGRRLPGAQPLVVDSLGFFRPAGRTRLSSALPGGDEEGEPPYPGFAVLTPGNDRRPYRAKLETVRLPQKVGCTESR